MSEPSSSREPRGYSTTARLLHWIVAGGIVLQYLLGERAEEAAVGGELALQLASLAQHKSIGITVLALVLARILWRWLQPPPPLPKSYRETNPTLVKIAAGTHILLYVLLVFLPLSGWLMSSASAYSVSWFGLITLPDLIGANEAVKDGLQSAHHLAAKILFVLALLHLAAAFKHLLIDKTGVMGRMASGASVGLFTATLVAGIWLTWPINSARTLQHKELQEDPEGTLASASALGLGLTQIQTDELPPLWKIDPAQSFIHFTAEQAGATFAGRWQRFNALINFERTNLLASRAFVRIDAASVATKDSERDSTLAGADWFDAENFSEVVFHAEKFEALELEDQEGATPSNFTAEAKLRIKGASYPIKFGFSVHREGNQRVLTGNARLDRLDLKLGTLEWADTDWVGQFVDVSVKVVASVPGPVAAK